MNQASILSVLRHVMTGLAGYAVASDWIDSGLADQAVAAVLGLVAVVWGIIDKQGR